MKMVLGKYRRSLYGLNLGKITIENNIILLKFPFNKIKQFIIKDIYSIEFTYADYHRFYVKLMKVTILNEIIYIIENQNANKKNDLCEYLKIRFKDKFINSEIERLKR